jgi:hypothetical protein
MKSTITPEQEQDLTRAIDELAYPDDGVTENMDWETIIRRIDKLSKTEQINQVKRFFSECCDMKNRRAYLLSEAMAQTKAWQGNISVLAESPECSKWVAHVGRAAHMNEEELSAFLRSDE